MKEKRSEKVKEKRKKKEKKKTKIKNRLTQLKIMVRIYHAAETGAMKLV